MNNKLLSKQYIPEYKSYMFQNNEFQQCATVSFKVQIKIEKFPESY